MFVFVDSVVFILFLSLSCLESQYFLARYFSHHQARCVNVSGIYVFAEDRNTLYKSIPC